MYSLSLFILYLFYSLPINKLPSSIVIRKNVLLDHQNAGLNTRPFALDWQIQLEQSFSNKIQMLQGQKYQEFIAQQGLLEQNIAEGWGYQINPTEYLPRKDKIPQKIKVARITPLRHLINLPASKKLEKIEEEIKMLENEKKLNELTEKAMSQVQNGDQSIGECAAVRMMHQCVDEYNFIVEHRHILEKNSEKARKIMGIHKKKSEIICQQIQVLKKQLPNTTISQKIRINEEITGLYREYQSCMWHSATNSELQSAYCSMSQANRTHTEGTSHNNSAFKTSKILPSKLTTKKQSFSISSQHSQFDRSNAKDEKIIEVKDLMIMQELNESEQGDTIIDNEIIDNNFELRQFPHSVLIDHGFLKLKRRTSQYAARRRVKTIVDCHATQKQQRKERMATTIADTFQKKEIIDKGKNLDRYIQESQDVVEVWKLRVQQNKLKTRNNVERFKPKIRAKQFRSHQEKHQQKKGEEVERIQRAERMNRQLLNDKANQVKLQLASKQRILSIILKKKQSKFKRTPGTNIMQKNDPNQTAKIFLGTAKRNHSTNDHRTSDSVRSQNLKQVVDENEPEWAKIEVYNQDLYWAMCRNEKLNILLRSKKD